MRTILWGRRFLLDWGLSPGRIILSPAIALVTSGDQGEKPAPGIVAPRENFPGAAFWTIPGRL